MTGTNGAATAPPGEAVGAVLRLTDAQRARLALYAEAVRRAQAAFEEAFANILIGRGVDLDTHEARLSPDGAAALIAPRRAPAGTEGGP